MNIAALLNPRTYTLRFDPQLEAKYEAAHGPERNRAISLYLIVYLAAKLLLLFANLKVGSQVFRVSMELRLGIILPITLLAVVLLRRALPQWIHGLAAFTPVVLETSLVMILGRLSRSAATERYVIAAGVGIFAQALLIQAPFRYCVRGLAAALAVFCTLCMVQWPGHFGPPISVDEIIFVIVLSLPALYERYGRERAARREFVLDEINQRRSEEMKEQIIAKDKALADLAAAQKELIELSRISGMAEVATAVLHNVGNVLNSVNVSATIVADRLRGSRVSQLGNLVALMNDHKGEIGDFLINDSRGQRVLPYLTSLSRHLDHERDELCKEADSMASHVGHIKEIVSMQQTYARSAGVYEDVALDDLMKDVVDIVRAGMERHSIALRKKSDEMPLIRTDRNKVVQILLNLMRNAKDAVRASIHEAREITVSMVRVGGDRVAIRIADNGIGIPPADLVKIFSHGFTTKTDGHGFGLHAGALAANQLGGSLTADSEGSTLGAIFTLELPISARGAAGGKATL